ncbi:MAG: response regulator [Lachnospiraceae bacterium]|nr:response regulator [Lachnospiraceae bacterium]
MSEKIRKYQRSLLTGLIVICMGIMVLGAVVYLKKVKNNLKSDAIQDVMELTIQQCRAFENFVSEDRERLHTFAAYFAELEDITGDVAYEQLQMVENADSIYSVLCLEEGWACSNSNEYQDIIQMNEEQLEFFRGLSGTGMWDNYTGIFTGVPMFGYYETFTFQNGHRGLVQKAYERSRVLETFTLSIYDGQGFGYILNPDGDILLRSVLRSDSETYDNIFDALSNAQISQADIDAFRAALEAQETGSIVFRGNAGDYIYTFAPIEGMDGWHILSTVPVDAIQNEADDILRDSQMVLWFFALMLVISSTFIFLVLRTQKEIRAKEGESAYQSQLFDYSFTFLAQNTDDLYMIFDHETEELEYVSPNLERVLGILPEELIDYFQVSDTAADAEDTLALYAKAKALHPGEMMEPRNTERINPKTGERKCFLENVYCIDIQGRKKRVSYFSDRTEERKTRDNLAEALHMAQAANDAKSAFLSSVSHDIRTPMNAIIGFLTLMRDEADNPDMVLEYNRRIEAASQHLLGLINDVLDMNKIESGSATLNISEMDMADVIDEINTIIRPQTKAKGQTFDIVATHMSFEHLLGDKLRLNQILINLLSNAVKYTPENGTIRLGVEEMPQVANNYSRVRFTVSDNGMGMSEAFQKVLFEPFAREEDNQAIHEIQGTGLGMPITKNLVEMMGGTIAVESKQGEGTTFIVEIEFRIQERDVDPAFWTDHKLAKLIVADDDEEVCYHIVKTMSKVGVITDYATNGHTAVQMMREHREAGQPYDMILLDWKMPTLDGIETARLIRKNYSDKIPILLLTAYDWSDIEQEAMEIGVDHFMPKPFFMSTFKEAVKRVMGSRQGKPVENNADVVRDKHILVVDDIEVNRMILLKMLSSLGAVCDSASNGQEAVDKFEASQPGDYDLILMDVQMPVMDGYTATRTIRDSGHPSAKSVPIIAMTANAFVDDVREAIESGMNAHIAKPVQIDNLKSTIRQVLDKGSAQIDG